MRKFVWAIMAVFCLGLTGSAFAEMSDPDVEGRIANINTIKNEIVVNNILYKEKKVGAREKRIKVKQGMINDYKLQDYVKVKLMADKKEAAMIEIIKH